MIRASPMAVKPGRFFEVVKQHRQNTYNNKGQNRLHYNPGDSLKARLSKQEGVDGVNR